MAGLDQIKRQARKEAWYSDSYNPFGKGLKRSSTFPTARDLEAGINTRNNGVLGESLRQDETPLSDVQTEPPHSRNFSQTTNRDTIRRGSMENEYEMTTAIATSSKHREADSEETAVEKRSSRPQSIEEKARRGFVGKFLKRGGERSGTPKAGMLERRSLAVRRWDGAPAGAERIGRDISRQPISVATENRRKVLRVLIKAKEHIACPDSGSEKNIMSEALAIELELDIRRRPRDIKKFELGSGKFVWSTGRVRAMVQLPSIALRRTKFWFYIFKACPVPLVMGMSLLAEAEILTGNRHVLEDSPPDLSSISSLLWIGSPRSDASKAKQPPNRLRCWLDGRCLLAVADTGSDLNMMSHKCARREGFPINTQPEARSCVLFGDGTEGETVGQVYVYNLTLDWRSAETKITDDPPLEVDGVGNVPERGQPNHDEQDVTEGSTLGAVFHVLQGLPCDVILGQSLLERTDAFNYCLGLLSSKSRDKTKLFEYNVLISLGPWTKKLSHFRNKAQNNTPALDGKKAHDDNRHDEMFRRSEKEAEIALMPVGQRAQEEAREKRMIEHWDALHVSCVHCN